VADALEAGRHRAGRQTGDPHPDEHRGTSDAETGRKVLKLMEQLDDHDDVQNVSSNFNIPDEAMAEIEAAT